MRCVAPITNWLSKWGRGVGVARPAQRVGEQVHALPWDEYGDLQDLVEGVICGVSERSGDSIGCGVDGGGGSRVGSDNETHWD